MGKVPELSVRRNELSQIPTARVVFWRAQAGWGREGCVAGMSRCVSSQTLSISSAGKNLCLGFQ